MLEGETQREREELERDGEKETEMLQPLMGKSERGDRRRSEERGKRRDESE